MTYNNNFFNFNGNPCYTSASFSDITYPTYNNFNQFSVSDWSNPNQYNPCPQSYDHNFQNNSNSSQSQWGFTSPESNFQPTFPPYPPCPQFSQYSFPDFASYTHFLDQPIEEKSELDKSIEAMQEAERKFQASLITQHFQDSYSVPPVQNRKLSILEMSMRDSKQQSQISPQISKQNFIFSSPMNQSTMRSCLKP